MSWSIYWPEAQLVTVAEHCPLTSENPAGQVKQIIGRVVVHVAQVEGHVGFGEHEAVAVLMVYPVAQLKQD